MCVCMCVCVCVCVRACVYIHVCRKACIMSASMHVYIMCGSFLIRLGASKMVKYGLLPAYISNSSVQPCTALYNSIQLCTALEI